MAKSKSAPGVQNKNIYTRASYLYQAANYLATKSQEQPSQEPQYQSKPASAAAARSENERKAAQNISRQLVTDMRAVSLKVLIRQSPELKRTICRYCDTMLVEGASCSSSIENPSRWGKKPWADVLVVRCGTCGNVKRFPVSAPRQKRRMLRDAEAKSKEKECGGEKAENGEKQAPTDMRD
jgi:ribonuclease P protein subunit RPR2